MYFLIETPEGTNEDLIISNLSKEFNVYKLDNIDISDLLNQVKQGEKKPRKPRKPKEEEKPKDEIIKPKKERKKKEETKKIVIDTKNTHLECE